MRLGIQTGAESYRLVTGMGKPDGSALIIEVENLSPDEISQTSKTRGRIRAYVTPGRFLPPEEPPETLDGLYYKVLEVELGVPEEFLVAHNGQTTVFLFLVPFFKPLTPGPFVNNILFQLGEFF